MLFLRSLAYNIYFYVTVSLLAVGGSVLFLIPGPQPVLGLVRLWARASLWGLKVICGITYELRGTENIPPGTRYIVAAKHQSVMETFTLPTIFLRTSYIHKRELFFLPFFGWLMWKGHQIGVDRNGKFGVIPALVAACRTAVERDRTIVIFPEGTRRPVGAEPRYKRGVTALYTELGLPVVPVALNSGVVWPRRKFLRKPGRFIIEILPPIEPGLEAEVFAARLQEVIETHSNALIKEATA